MGAWLKCEECENTYRYGSDEIDDIGTIWHPIWAVTCHNCGTLITHDTGFSDFMGFDNVQVSSRRTEDDGLTFSFKSSEKSAHERAESNDIREYWIQQYVKEHFKKLGFSKIEGPFSDGPDFKGVYKGKKAVVEVERRCQSFIAHKHHLDPNFKKVNLLIVLNPSEPSEKIIEKLPETIIYIDVDDFVEWFRPYENYDAKWEKTRTIRNLIAGEFKKRYIRDFGNEKRHSSLLVEIMISKNQFIRDFINSENRNSYQSRIIENMTSAFIDLHKYPIESEDFSLSVVTPLEIDKFYTQYVSENLNGEKK